LEIRSRARDFVFCMTKHGVSSRGSLVSRALCAQESQLIEVNKCLTKPWYVLLPLLVSLSRCYLLITKASDKGVQYATPFLV
jgi:hypothetical protein